MPPAGPFDPDRLATTEFSTAFRGYDTGEVRALLHAVGESLREAAEREHELREQLARAEHHLRELRETSAAQVEEAAEEARREGREMVAEAQRVRERMLGDLARRRRNARQQVEQLMAGRERLLEAFDAARHTIDAATQDMRGALPEARLAAEAAGRRFDQDVAGEEDDVAVAALEDEIEAARLVGLPLVAPGPEPAAAPEPAARPESSLLGERDMREMPPVELSADFEDVRIVPVEAAEPASAPEVEAASEEEENAAAAVDESVDAGDQPDAKPVADEVDAVPGPVEGDEVATAEVESVDADEPVDEAPTEAVEPEAPDADADDAPLAVDTEPSADADGTADEDAPPQEPEAAEEDAEEAAPVDPAHLDDLFASLRAARAEAVTDARTVLARDEPADTDADEDTAPEADAGEPDPPADPGADEFVAPAPVDEADADPVPPTPADDEPPADEPGLEVHPTDGAESESEVTAEVEEPSEDAPAPADDEPPAVALDVEQAIAEAGERLASALKRVLAHEQNDLLDRLRHVGRGQRADAQEVLGDADDLAARFAAAAHEPLAGVAAAAMASAGPDGRARPPAVETLARAAATELVEPLHERLTRGFGEAGTDTAEASARARATFREWKTRRIGVCANDAARGAFHAGLLAGVSRTTSLVWALDDEDAACPECADNALAGPVGRGERYPTGHRHPPAHDGCRCTLVVPEEPTP